MSTDVRVPTTGNAGEDAVVIDWNVAVGDTVNAGDVLVVLETAKSTIDVEAPVAGLVLKLLYDVGDEAPEHHVLAILGAEGEAAAETVSAETATATAETAATAPTSARAIASPRARIMAGRRNVDLSNLMGTGPGGRIIVGDVLAASSTPPAAPSEAPPAAAAEPRLERSSPADSAFVDVPVRGARKVTAERMHESLQSTAQVTLTRYAGADALLGYAARLRTVTESRGLPKIGINDLLLFAVARTVVRHPAANSWFGWESIRQFSSVNLGFAVDTGQALLVPVIRHADGMTLADVAESSRSLIEKSRAGKLTTDEMDGGTFTVSNLGGLGIHWFTPVLNPPQSCILGVGATHTPYPDAPALLPLSLTFDHRAIDGAGAAALLADIAVAIETIDTLAAF